MARSMKSVPEDLLRQLADEIRVWRQESESGAPALDDATLAAYAAGTLDEAERARVEEQLAASPELAETVAAVRETLAAGDWQGESPGLPPRLRVPLVLGPSVPQAAPLVPARRRATVRRWAAAAALVAVFVLCTAAGAMLFGNSIRDCFRVKIERLGGNDSSALDSSITTSAKGQTVRSIADLKDQKAEKGAKGLSTLKNP